MQENPSLKDKITAAMFEKIRNNDRLFLFKASASKRKNPDTQIPNEHLDLASKHLRSE